MCMINAEVILDILGISVLTALSIGAIVVISGLCVLFCKAIKEALKGRNWH